MRKIPLMVAAAALLFSTCPARADEAARKLAFGSGEVTGFYYPAAGAVCRLVNRDRQHHGLHCLVEPSGGSAANLAELRSGAIDLAMVQSKSQQQAFTGTGPFQADGAFADMRSLFSLHGEAMVVLVRKDAKIKSLGDLKGKRVNLGRAGTFQRAMADSLVEAQGWTGKDFSAALEMDLLDMAEAMCNEQIDAAVYTGVHPTPEIQQAVECGATLLSIKDKSLDGLMKQAPWLARQKIPEGTYAGQTDDVTTFGMKATVVTSAKMPDDVAYNLVKSVFENFDPLVGMHPVLGQLVKEQMAKDGLTAPLHPGAARYFREAGLIQQ